MTAAPPASLVSLRSVGIQFGHKQVLKGIDLDVEDGAFVSIIGADGSGKSTLLRILAGLRRCSEGEVTHSLSKQVMGFSGSEFDLYGDLTVMENLRFFASVRGLDKTRFRHAADQILDMVGLTDAADSLAAALSGGMKKKLGLAVALIHTPRLLLLDEPTAGVDPTSRRELWGIVAQAHAAGTAVVFTTTYLDEAERARHVLLLSEGKTAEMSPEQMNISTEGWQAWTLSEETGRRQLRVALARAGLDARVYLRPEGLTVLARDRGEAVELARRVISCLTTGGIGWLHSEAPVLEPAALTLDDLFVLIQMGLAGHEKSAR